MRAARVQARTARDARESLAVDRAAIIEAGNCPWYGSYPSARFWSPKASSASAPLSASRTACRFMSVGMTKAPVNVSSQLVMGECSTIMAAVLAF